MLGGRIKPFVACALIAILAAAPAAAAQGPSPASRPLAALYPKLDAAILASLLSSGSYSADSDKTEPALLPAGEAGAAIAAALEGRQRGFLVETLALVPGAKAASKLELYNCATKYRALSGVTYSSKSHGDGAVLFSEVTRLSDLKKAKAVPDVAVSLLPESADHFLRLKDANFGTCYYEAALNTKAPGIVLALSNARPLSYLFIPVVPVGGMFCVFYVEQVKEGLLIYGASGGNLSGAAAKQINIPSAVRKRAAAIAGWLASSLGR